ncbi:MAG TPA: septal ring lytic transglycosylase RlpA family protein [Chthoniobacterales bacterium]|jgi:rare lipoprotein A|nr:septal ring lytic transglycosylase RlpA family protein [Chthoniobacterales bacterium]
MVALLWPGAFFVCTTEAADRKKPGPQTFEGNAVWYPVPPNSLAKKRAGKDELTAAHNRLPIGTKLRVTHLKNKKSVVVRVTDRGIKDRRFMIDLCREAAEKLDMLREGSTRVRLEVLPDELTTSLKW